MRNIFGMSLMELMIALVVMGILTSIALPQYSQHYQRAQRLQAEVELFRLATALENYFVIHASYQGASLESLHFPASIANGRYQLVLTNIENAFFTAQAQPLGRQRDAICGTLTLNARGEKNIGGSGKITDCW